MTEAIIQGCPVCKQPRAAGHSNDCALGIYIKGMFDAEKSEDLQLGDRDLTLGSVERELRYLLGEKRAFGDRGNLERFNSLGELIGDEISDELHTALRKANRTRARAAIEALLGAGVSQWGEADLNQLKILFALADQK